MTDRPTTTTCIACGLTDYDIAPRWGRTRADGTRPQSQFCRWCAVKPEITAQFRKAAARRAGRDHMRRKRQADALATRTVAVPPRVILGPCPCHDCGAMLVWTGLEWQHAASGYRHSHRRLAA